MFDNNFGNCEPIFIFFHQVIRKKILYDMSLRFPSHLQYVATLPCEFENSKMLLTLTAPQQTVDMFLRTTEDLI